MYINLETERLILRPITLNDADFILELVNSKGWLKFIGDRNISDKKDAEKYIQKILDNNDFYYNVFQLKESLKPIGIITFLRREDEDFPDFGFALLPEFENNGYAFEVSKLYLQKIKKTNKHDTIIAITLPNNKKSIKLLQKLGFQYKVAVKKDATILSHYNLENTH